MYLFDKMNHCGIFIKLVERHIPVNLLSLLEHWFSIGVTCVKWGSRLSRFFDLACGIRQGGVLSPYLFSVYIDYVIRKVSDSKFASFLKGICISILLYADDIILVAPSVSYLLRLLFVCEQYVRHCWNVVCVRFLPLTFSLPCIHLPCDR